MSSDDQNSPPTSGSARLTAWILRIAAAGAVGGGVWLVSRGWGSLTGDQLLVFLGVPLALAATLTAASFARPETRLGILLTLGSTGLSLYLAELALLFVAGSPQLRSAAGGAVWSPDTRVETLRQLRKDDPSVYPIIPAQMLKTRRFAGRQPLSPTVPLSRAVLCDEAGPLVFYEADELGFNNPQGLWGQGSVDVAVVGDSYTAGVCVETGQRFADLLRVEWPSLVNVGVTGAGPLTELAILREYVAPLEPDLVVWVYYEGNDLVDLRLEEDDDVLPEYVDPAFSQDLLRAHRAVDERMRVHLDSLVAGERAEVPPGPSLRQLLREALALRTLRNLAGIQVLVPKASTPTRSLPAILARARADVDAWGGRLVLVYLPAWLRFHSWIGDAPPGRPQVLATADSLGIPVIDLAPVFRATGDAESLWRRPDAHLTPEGNRVVAEAIRALI